MNTEIVIIAQIYFAMMKRETLTTSMLGTLELFYMNCFKIKNLLKKIVKQLWLVLFQSIKAALLSYKESIIN
jgi:hypothetical protein